MEFSITEFQSSPQRFRDDFPNSVECFEQFRIVELLFETSRDEPSGSQAAGGVAPSAGQSSRSLSGRVCEIREENEASQKVDVVPNREPVENVDVLRLRKSTPARDCKPGATLMHTRKGWVNGTSR